MIKRFFGFLWRTITAVRSTLANLVFLLFLAALWFVLTDAPEPLPERAALLLNPTGQVVDERSRIDAAGFLFEQDAASREVLLTDLIDSVELAKDDERITALVIEPTGVLSMGQSKVWELSQALERFRATGKPIVAVGDYFAQHQYRLAVEADTVLMHPFGAVALSGYGVYLNYFADALEKLSVSMHVYRAGEFKSAAEPFLRNDMSPGERDITRRWVSDIWKAYTDRVEERRGLAAGSVDIMLNDYAEHVRAAGGNGGDLAMAENLVDDLLDRSQRNEYLSTLVGARDEEGRYAAIAFDDYLARQRPRDLAPGQANVAILTAQGNMIPGEQPPGTIGGDSLARRLRETAERDGTEAIVLRISSGGGSVFASEIIREEMARIRASGMPLVVSMGSIAASGGYYIATAADRIVATPTSITGSIGVFGAFPTIENLLARGGIHTDGVGTTAIAGGLRADRPLNSQVSDAIQQTIDDTYEHFLGLVMEARALSRERVEAIAEGRTLSATQAYEAGLIDTLGGLDEAVQEAAELAGLAEGSYEVISIAPDFDSRQLLLQQISDMFGATYLSIPALQALGQWLAPAADQLDVLSAMRDPQHLYMRCLACGL